MRGLLTWNPVHTEQFWQTSFIFFNEAENLQCIDKLLEVLKKEPSRVLDAQTLDTMKAVACYDLGEFARFFPLGKRYLEERSARENIAILMGAA